MRRLRGEYSSRGRIFLTPLFYLRYPYSSQLDSFTLAAFIKKSRKMAWMGVIAFGMLSLWEFQTIAYTAMPRDVLFIRH